MTRAGWGKTVDCPFKPPLIESTRPVYEIWLIDPHDSNQKSLDTWGWIHVNVFFVEQEFSSVFTPFIWITVNLTAASVWGQIISSCRCPAAVWPISPHLATVKDCLLFSGNTWCLLSYSCSLDGLDSLIMHGPLPPHLPSLQCIALDVPWHQNIPHGRQQWWWSHWAEVSVSVQGEDKERELCFIACERQREGGDGGSSN